MIKLSVQIRWILAMVIFGFFVSACKKKDNPAPSSTSSTSNTTTHTSGETEGSITINDTTTAISGSSTNSSYGFTMFSRNMNPPNSYPYLTFDFKSIPTKDSTYAITTNDFFSVSVSSSNSYYATSLIGGSIVVKMSSGSFTATVSNVKATNNSNDTLTVSGYIKYYE